MSATRVMLSLSLKPSISKKEFLSVGNKIKKTKKKRDFEVGLGRSRITKAIAQV
jgi:hypothetical protein